MATLSFRLNKGLKIKNLKAPQSIYFRYRGTSVDFGASIKQFVLPMDWDAIKEQIKTSSKQKDKTAINDLITALKKHFNDFDNDNIRRGIIPNFDMVKKRFNDFFYTPPPETKPKDLFSFIDLVIEKAKTEIHPKTKMRLSPITIRGYGTTKNKMLRYCKDENTQLTFDNLDEEFYHNFVAYCEEEGGTANYIGKHIKNIKVFVRLAIKKGLTTNAKFLDRDIVVLKEDVFNIYLNKEELNKMWEIDLSKRHQHSIARDLFLIGADTGLRISDYNNLTKDNFKIVQGVEMIKIRMQKGKKDVAIPLTKIVKLLVEKYKMQFPKMPNQKINKYIKDVAEWCGIDEKISYKQMRGGEEKTIKKNKFQLVKSHTARRSFCSNAYLEGWDVLDIMTISGHKKEETLMNYIKLSAEERAVKISKHQHFK